MSNPKTSKNDILKRRLKVFRLRIIEGKSYKELGEMFDRVPQTMRSDCEKIKRKFAFADYIPYGKNFFYSIDPDNITEKQKQKINKALELYKAR